jgi:hypothetical protein
MWQAPGAAYDRLTMELLTGAAPKPADREGPSVRTRRFARAVLVMLLALVCTILVSIPAADAAPRPSQERTSDALERARSLVRASGHRFILQDWIWQRRNRVLTANFYRDTRTWRLYKPVRITFRNGRARSFHVSRTRRFCRVTGRQNRCAFRLKPVRLPLR